MGAEQGKLDTVKMSSLLRQSISRINIHRGKKLNGIAKKKDDICKHLESGNEMNAKIWAETLINEENMIPCFDIVSILCDQLNGRLQTIKKFGPPKDMDQNFRTLIYASVRLEIDELIQVRRHLGKLLGPKFLIEAEKDESAINKVIAAQINIRIPEEGEIIKRLVELAKERNIDYKPSAEAQQQLNDYIDRKGIPHPSTGQMPVAQSLAPPVYNPQPFDNSMFPPPPGGMDVQGHGGQPPAFLPPPGGNNFMPGLPQYMPQQQPPFNPPGVYPGFMPPATGQNGFQQPPPVYGAPAYNYAQFDPNSQPQNMNGGFDGGSTQQPPQNFDNFDDIQAKLDKLKHLD